MPYLPGKAGFSRCLKCHCRFWTRSRRRVAFSRYRGRSGTTTSMLPRSPCWSRSPKSSRRIQTTACCSPSRRRTRFRSRSGIRAPSRSFRSSIPFLRRRRHFSPAPGAWPRRDIGRFSQRLWTSAKGNKFRRLWKIIQITLESDILRHCPE